MNPYQGEYDEKGYKPVHRWALHVVLESGELRVINVGSEYEAQKARDSYLSTGRCAWIKDTWKVPNEH
jgi:hypothetical protein